MNLLKIFQSRVKNKCTFIASSWRTRVKLWGKHWHSNLRHESSLNDKMLNTDCGQLPCKTIQNPIVPCVYWWKIELVNKHTSMQIDECMLYVCIHTFVRTDTHTHTRTQLFTENENTKSFSCCRVLGSELQPFTSAVTRHQWSGQGEV